MKTPKQMWLVYTPAERYESSVQPHLICPDQETANACKNKINQFVKSLVNRLPDMDVDGDDWYSKNWDKRTAMLGKARWPYCINREYDLNDPVDIKPIPFRGAA
jgi:hypothetical protein